MTSTFENDIVIREQIAETMMVEIDEKCEESNDRRHSRRLGSSQIGLACSRQIWYGFRWAKKPELGSTGRPAGRVIRLFNRGHREEPVLIKHLETIGCRFIPPPDGKEQHEVSAHEDHAITKLDGIGYMPKKFGIEAPVLFEFKTANINSFAKIKKHGVQRENPRYWAQACFSAELAKLDYVLFVFSSKNDDDLHIEFLKIDHEYGQQLLDKAMYVITANAQEPPLKVSQSATNFACKWCDFKDICHYEEKVEINCRSCQHAKPTTNGGWICTNDAFQFEGDGMVIPDEIIKLGCGYHKGIQ